MLKKVGISLFIAGAIYMVGMGVIVGWSSINLELRELTVEQFNNTIWTRDGLLFIAWGASVPLGSLLAIIGVLIYVRAKSSVICLFGFGITVITYIVARELPNEHYPALYGSGGTLILIFFLAILIFWVKRQKILKESAKVAGYFQLASYTFFLTTAWYLCKTHGTPYMKALEKDPIVSPVEVIIFFVLGWFFLFLSHYKSISNED